ncbi:MAG: hypothetical protein CML24_01330 [Rhizobiales bacterium]|nr:hypothetical protein [Hyphomicrobiales bacterium]
MDWPGRDVGQRIVVIPDLIGEALAPELVVQSRALGGTGSRLKAGKTEEKEARADQAKVD